MASEVKVTFSEYKGYQTTLFTQQHEDPEAPHVVLAGGYGQRGSYRRDVGWGRLGHYVADWATVSTAELPGLAYGAAPQPPSMDFYAQSLGNALLAAGYDKPICALGGSFSATLIYHYALHCQNVGDKATSGIDAGPRLDSMLLLGAPHQLGERQRHRLEQGIEILREGDYGAFVQQALDTILNEYPSDKVHRQRQAARVLALAFGDAGNSRQDAERHIRNMRQILAEDHFPNPEQLAIPTLVATGEHDSLTTVDQCRALAFGLKPNCKEFAVINDADHAVHLEQPEALARLMQWHFTTPANDRQLLQDVAAGCMVEPIS